MRLLVILLVAVSLLQAIALVTGPRLHGNDFKHLWAGAYLLQHEVNPYHYENLIYLARHMGWSGMNPFVYLPTTGLAMGSLARFPYETAMHIWFWLNWALAWLLVLFGPWLLRLDRPMGACLAGAVFVAGGFPFYRQLTAGQMNVVGAALILLAAAAVARRKPFWTGLALAAGVGWKIAPALLLAVLAPLKRWRAMGHGLACCLAMLAAAVALCGWTVHRDAFAMISRMGYGMSTWAEFGMQFYRDPFNQSPNALMHHLLTENPFTEPWVFYGPAVANGATVAVSLLLVMAWLWAARRFWRGSDVRRAAEQAQSVRLFLAASLLMLLLPSLMWDHYCVQALPALMWIFGDRRTWRRPGRAIGAALILAAVTVPWFHVHPNWRSGPGILFMSLRLWPMLALYVWLLADRRLTHAASDAV